MSLDVQAGFYRFELISLLRELSLRHMKKGLALLAVALSLTGCGRDIKNSTLYGPEYVPPRSFESSVLNEPDAQNKNPNAGRGYRINGSGYGPEVHAVVVEKEAKH